MSGQPLTAAAARRRWLLPAAFLLLGTIWGSSFVWIKIAIEELPPATLVAERLMLGAVAMLILLAFTRPARPTRGQVGHLAVMGFVNAGLPIFLISWGEQFIDSGTAAVLNSLVPIFSLLIAGLILRTERWSLFRVMGILIGFAGATVLASREFAFNPGPAAIGGAVAVAAAALSYAIGASYGKYRIESTDRYVVAGGTLVFAALYVTIVAILADGGLTLPTQPATIVGLLWLGLLGSFVAYVLYFFLLSHLGATVSTMTTYMFPVVGVTLGVLVLGESLDARLLLGTGLVVLGIAIVGLRYDSVVSLATRVARR
ncbi:MAG TPA: DMT family transporter [Candidatus Limnocylindria bacterium]|jgi:drug/metabolite transporter (DMT)-like permease|nr:DMT family transporter [Candidatus Limnocylindria bacterium]